MDTPRTTPTRIKTETASPDAVKTPKELVAELTGIPIATIFLWTRDIPSRGRGRPESRSEAMQESGFRELAWPAMPTEVAQGWKNSVVGVNALTGKMTAASPAGLVIEGPGGFRVSGFHSMTDAAGFLREVCR